MIGIVDKGDTLKYNRSMRTRLGRNVRRNRLARVALKPEQLLVNRESVGEDIEGYWCFEEPNFFKDSSPNGHNIRSDIAPSGSADAKTAALIDFCHLLFNANEFFYVD